MFSDTDAEHGYADTDEDLRNWPNCSLNETVSYVDPNPNTEKCNSALTENKRWSRNMCHKCHKGK